MNDEFDMKRKKLVLSLEINVSDYVAQYTSIPWLIQNYDFLAGFTREEGYAVPSFTIKRKVIIRTKSSMPKLDRMKKDHDPNRFHLHFDDEGPKETAYPSRLIAGKSVVHLNARERSNWLMLASKSNKPSRLFVFASPYDAKTLFFQDGEERRERLLSEPIFVGMSILYPNGAVRQNSAFGAQHPPSDNPLQRARAIEWYHLNRAKQAKETFENEKRRIEGIMAASNRDGYRPPFDETEVVANLEKLRDHARECQAAYDAARVATEEANPNASQRIAAENRAFADSISQKLEDIKL